MPDGDITELNLYRSGLPHAAVNARIDAIVEAMHALNGRVIAVEVRLDPTVNIEQPPAIVTDGEKPY